MIQNILDPNTFLSTPSARRATTAKANGREPSKFLSTPSARRATDVWRFPITNTAISIHALREEGDSGPPSNSSRQTSFLSTPSARRAT